jgi:hypothetical protein
MEPSYDAMDLHSSSVKVSTRSEAGFARFADVQEMARAIELTKETRLEKPPTRDWVQMTGGYVQGAD